jgi:hypothetical protein
MNEWHFATLPVAIDPHHHGVLSSSGYKIRCSRSFHVAPQQLP